MTFLFQQIFVILSEEIGTVDERENEKELEASCTVEDPAIRAGENCGLLCEPDFEFTLIKVLVQDAVLVEERNVDDSAIVAERPFCKGKPSGRVLILGTRIVILAVL